MTRAADERLTDADWLRERYVERELTTYDIADKCDCSKSSVVRWMRKHGIETRSPSRAADERLTDREWLRRQVHELDKTGTDIAEICDCDSSTVYNWFQHHDIDTGQSTLAAKLRATDCDPFSGVGGDD